MRDGKYLVEYVTQNMLDEEQRIRIGEYTIEHDWIIDVQGELENEIHPGELTPQIEVILEQGYNNGYYQTTNISGSAEPEPRKRTPLWSAG